MLLLLLSCTEGKDSVKESAEESSAEIPTLSEDIQPIFDRNCIYCHAGDQPSESLNLEAGEARAALVGVPSIQVPSMSRVAEGDAGNSYLVYKLKASQADVGGSGTRMPPELMLVASELALFEAWINAGAPE
jgi:hypothetical protein